MFPLHVLPASKRVPVWTRLLAVACALVFAVQLWFWLADGVDVASVWGMRPRCLWDAGECGLETGEAWLRIGSAAFLHGDWLHLAFNIWFLLVFGGALEGEIGGWRWLLCFTFGALAATLAHAISTPFSLVPAIGASGGIAALLGAFLVRVPRAWVLSFVPPIFLLPVPAPLFLLVWFALQVWGAWSGALEALLPGTTPLHAPAGGGIAWWAHLGGFAFGVAWGWKTRSRRRRASPLTA